MPITLALMDGQQLYRDAVRYVLEQLGEFHVVGEASSGVSGLRMLRSAPWNVVVTELDFADGPSGMELIQRIHSTFPERAIFVVTQRHPLHVAWRVYAAGASGYLRKTAPLDELVKGVRRVATGMRYLNEDAIESVLECRTGGDDFAACLGDLSDREFEVFVALAHGDSTGEIARNLSLSASTVSTHKKRLLAKLGITSMTELVKIALDQDVINDSAP